MIILKPASLDTPEYYKLGMNAGFAVMFFYTISGFLMSIVLSEKYSPTAAGTANFYRSRFIGIFSLYWPMVIVVLIVPDIRHMMLSDPPADKFTNFFLLGMDWRVSFASYPSDHWDAPHDLRTQAGLDAERGIKLLSVGPIRTAIQKTDSPFSDRISGDKSLRGLPDRNRSTMDLLLSSVDIRVFSDRACFALRLSRMASDECQGRGTSTFGRFSRIPASPHICGLG